MTSRPAPPGMAAAFALIHKFHAHQKNRKRIQKKTQTYMKNKSVIQVNGKPVNAAKFELSVKLAHSVLLQPVGAWPQTEQAKLQLEEALPKNLTYTEAIEIARKQK